MYTTQPAPQGITARGLLHVSKRTLAAWWRREPFRNAAILSYFTIFSLPGVLTIIIFVSSQFFGREAVVGNISQQFGNLIGNNVAEFIESMIASAEMSEGSAWTTIVSIATLLFGATGVFYHLQLLLNEIWDENDHKKKIITIVFDRILAFGVIVSVGFFLVVSLVLSTLINVMSAWFSAHLFEGVTILFNLIDFLVSMVTLSLLFALIYKVLPDGRVRWIPALYGGLFTATLFVAVKYLLAYYFTVADPASTYGAASSLVLLMLWITYTSLLLLCGAEFTHKLSTSDMLASKPNSPNLQDQSDE